MRSDHSAVRLTFSNRSFKFNSTYVERPVIDWKRIQDCEDTNQLFNVNLQGMLKKNMSYTLFNEAILNSPQQSAMTNRQSNERRFHHRKSTLNPELSARNEIIHSIRDLNYLVHPYCFLWREILISSYAVKNFISCCQLWSKCALAMVKPSLVALPVFHCWFLGTD